MIHRLTISKRLFILMTIFSVLVAITGGAGIKGMNQVYENQYHISSTEVPAMNDLRSANIDLYQAVQALMVLQLAPTDSELEKQVALFNKNIDDTEKRVTAYKTLMSELDEDLNITAFGSEFNLFITYSEKLIAAVKRGENPKEHSEKCLETFEIVEDLLDGITDNLMMVINNHTTLSHDLFQRTALFMILFIIASISLGIFLGARIYQSIVNPLLNIVHYAEETQKGNLTHELKIAGNDEIARLGHSILRMNSYLLEIIRGIKENSDTVIIASDSLFVVSDELLVNSQNMINSATEGAEVTGEMSVNIHTMANAAEEMSVNANNVAGAAEETNENMLAVSSAVEKMSGSINQIAEDSKHASSIAEKAIVSSKRATSAMNLLNDASKEIGTVTEMIKKVAEKTNLLALNATIEAASAGEAGKGFAVVAGEIKELANQSALAADRIAEKIHGVQDNSEETVQVISAVSQVIQEIDNSVNGIADAVQLQSNAMIDISNNVINAGNGVKNIAAAIAEVAKGSNDVSRNASEASVGIARVKKQIESINSSTDLTNENAVKINSTSKEMRTTSVKLSEVISHFITE